MTKYSSQSSRWLQRRSEDDTILRGGGVRFHWHVAMPDGRHGTVASRTSSQCILFCAYFSRRLKCHKSMIARTLKHLGVHGVSIREPINAGGCNNLKRIRPRNGRPGGIEYYVEMAVQKHRPGALLILLDADDECQHPLPVNERLGPRLLERAKSVAGTVPVGVVVANRQFEAWLVAAWPQMQGKVTAECSDKISDTDSREAEQRAGHDEKLGEALGTKYKKPKHQAALAKHLPLEGAVLERAPSYARFLQTVRRLTENASNAGGTRSGNSLQC